MSDLSGVNKDNVPPQEPTDTRERTRAEIERDECRTCVCFLVVLLLVVLFYGTLFCLHAESTLRELFESIEGVECFVRSACSTCPSRQPLCEKLQQAMNTTKQFLAK